MTAAEIKERAAMLHAELLVHGSPLNHTRAAEMIERALTHAANAGAEIEREACAKIADDYRKRAVAVSDPQIVLLGGAAQIIRNAIRARGTR